jgi:ribosomal protein S18 acetylase RimI-like enzyme
MGRGQARIRPYRPSDLDELYRICLLTGDAGQDATALYQDPRLLGHIFAAPYGVLEPALAFVAEDAAGVGGYIVGALDTQAFEERLESDWWPGLRGRYPDPAAGLPEGRWTPDQQLAHAIHHPWRSDPEHAACYPTHLHVNLEPRLQGRGYGARLTRTLIAALRDGGSRGVHLYVMASNHRAAGFYGHLGFSELPSAHGHLFGLDLQLTP